MFRLLAGLSFLAIFTLFELLIQIIGFTYKFNKINIVCLSLNIFSNFLLFYFILDNWHYATIWYIFIVTSVPTSFMEAYAFIYAIFFELLIYRKLKNQTIKPVKS